MPFALVAITLLSFAPSAHADPLTRSCVPVAPRTATSVGVEQWTVTTLLVFAAPTETDVVLTCWYQTSNTVGEQVISGTDRECGQVNPSVPVGACQFQVTFAVDPDDHVYLCGRISWFDEEESDNVDCSEQLDRD